MEMVELMGFWGILCVFAWDNHSLLFFVSNLCLECGLPSFEQMNIYLYIKVERLEHWVRACGGAHSNFVVGLSLSIVWIRSQA